MDIQSTTLRNGGIDVRWQQGTALFFSAFWLRDHCDDELSQDQNTRQRKVDTFAIPSDIQVQNVQLDEHAGVIVLHWSDGTRNTITAEQLGRAAFSEQERAATAHVHWSARKPLQTLPEIASSEILASEAGSLAWVELIAQYGFAVVTGVEPSEQGTVKLGDCIGPAQRTIFGTYWPLSAELSEHEDTAYSRQTLLPHTDGTYYHNAAGLQMFNCLAFDGTGGESVLVDGFAIAEQMRTDCPEYFDTLCRVSVPGQYLEPGVHLHAERPVIALDRHDAVQQVSFNNYDRAPMHLDEETQARFYAAYTEFNRRTLDESGWLKIPLREGTALIFDNWRCLHGRMGYTGKRVFYGCYHNRADYESRLRTLRDKTQ